MLGAKQRRLLTLGGLALLLAAGLGFSPPLSAQEASNGKMVTLGKSSASGVKIVRGPVSAKAPEQLAERTAPVDSAAGLRIVAGEHLWLIDASGERLIGCRLRNTVYVGGTRMTCTSRSFR